MRTKRVFGLAVAATAGLLLAGCGGGQSAEPSAAPPPAKDVFQNFDPCAALSPEEIQSFGASPEPIPNDLGIGEAGCDYQGEGLIFGVLEAPENDKAYWEGQRGQFDSFVPNQVGTHEGFVGIVLGGTGQGVCRQMMYVGSGSVIVDITLSSNAIEGRDPCAEAMKIAEVVETRLPA
ncbi:DUF3558 family protein [Saccharopolyspora sp. CA-218241]|uniref:DUF3558 family protein n=1 Tax=Saccharopolyspora sp. CA-218241 TaxID=3240027 RepID=UPI003D974105